MRTYLLHALSALIATAAMAAEVPVTQPVYIPAPNQQLHAAAASNGDQYLTVWLDRRSDMTQVYAARVASDGTVLDPNGFRVASSGLTYYPNVIWGGNAWFVFSKTCKEIELVRVAANGVVLDPTPRRFPASGWCPGFSAAAGGGHVAIGYLTSNFVYEKRVLILDGDGDAVADIRLSAGDPDQTAPAITWDGSAFLAVWEGQAVRFDRSGVLGPGREIHFSSTGPTRIASNGRDFLIMRGGIVFRMTSDYVVQLVNLLSFDVVHSLEWTGSAWAISGAEMSNDGQYRKITRIVLLERDGHVVLGRKELQSEGRDGLVNATPVATNGRNLLVAWHDTTEAEDVPYRENDTYATIVSLPDLTPEPRRLLSGAAPWQRRPSTAAGRNNQLTVWQERSGIYARRHTRNGATDPSPLKVAPWAQSMAVAFNGSDYIAATTMNDDVVAMRLPATGELRVLSESRLQHSGGPDFIALASEDGVTVAAWLDSFGIRAARIGGDGSWIDQVPLEVAPPRLTRATHRVAISPNGRGEFLVVWGGSIPMCYPCSPPMPAQAGVLRAARVTSAFTLLDRVPIEVAVPVDESNFVDHPSVTWNGSEWLVVWNRSTDAGEEIRGRRIARNGTLLDGASRDPGVLIAPDGFAPTVAWTGFTYLLGWYDGSPNYHWVSQASELLRIRTATFERPGGALSNQRTLGQAIHEDLVSIAIANGFASLAYARLGDDARYGGVPRAFVEIPDADAKRRTVRR